MKRSHIVWIILIIVLLIDQLLKFYIKTNFYYGETYKIFGLDWAQLHFIENNGMAFGIEFGGKCIGFRDDAGNCKGLFLSPEGGKILLSGFRIVMIGFLIYLLRDLIKMKESKGLIAAFTLILAGAIGNMIDSAFYGIIFSNSPYHTDITAELFPAQGGYSKFLFGQVVDMFYFPLIDTHWPEWLPWLGGKRLEFFQPVFNVADSAISIGVATILLFYNKFLFRKDQDSPENLSKSESN